MSNYLYFKRSAICFAAALDYVPQCFRDRRYEVSVVLSDRAWLQSRGAIAYGTSVQP
ncbi:MAG TPA: hypothetical protein V6D26_25135 [Stenomitos sp.]